jgi:site-specific recombinase XerD
MSYHDELKIELDFHANDIIATLPDFSKKFFNHIKDQGMSARTKLQYAYDMKRFFTFLSESAGFKEKKIKTMSAAEVLDPLSIEDIQEYIESLDYYEVTDKNGNLKTKLASPSTKARRISSLRSFYRYYFKLGEIKNNLADLMDIPKIPDKNVLIMKPEHVARLLAAVSDETGMSEGEIKRHSKIIKRDFAIMMVLLGTGIRISELVGLDYDDVDFYEGSLIVTRKGGNQDAVYFGSEVEEALADYMECDRPTLLSGADEMALFISMQHKRISPRSVEVMMKKYAEKAGLNMKVTPHTCRRSFGTNLYEETGDIYLVADALAHTSVETTKKHYAKMSKDHKRIAAKKSSTLFRK